MAHYVVRIARQAGLAALFVAAAVAGTLSGVVFAYMGDLPQISALDDYSPNTITRVLGVNGELVGDFATERRIVIGYEDVSPKLREAILAAEDAEFNSHVGLSISRILITAINDILRRRMAGASTLTQQLARNLFPIGFERTWERKIKEAMLAIQIEKRYTKKEIFAFYCNQIYLGHGAYGMEAGARLFFGKHAKDVTLEEAALLAGIIQGNIRQSPFLYPDRALRRRNYTLDRMAEVGYITLEEAEQAKRKPIVLRGESAQDHSLAPYFLEEVRKYLEAKYGAKRLYESGLTVYTSLDMTLQRAANAAVDEGLRRIDKRRGFRAPKRNIIGEGHSLDSFQHERWSRSIVPGAISPAVVLGTEGGRIQLRIGRYRGEIARDGLAWTRRTSGAQLVKPGDLIDARIVALDSAAGTLKASLEQEPVVEGALLAIDNRTGQVRAMVGGYSFERSKFNRAVQAARQVGSAFKPFVYTAAIDRGYTPTSVIVDAPVAYPGGAGQPVYSPQNYDHRFEGTVTLRHALEQSRNVPAVRVMDQLGPPQVIGYARRLGLTSPIPPVLSVALGAAEATLVEVTSAYSVFPNQGVRMRPYFVLKVTDRDGNVLEENRPEPHDAIRADTAFVMTNLLRGVVLRGTAASAASLNWPLGGKTGTTDDYTDAWFIGFDPDLTAGVWVGRDEKKPIGYNETGAVAALPMWIAFMRDYIGTRQEASDFPPPGNIVFLAVDRQTGGVTDPTAPGAINEVFISGTQPGAGLPRQ